MMPIHWQSPLQPVRTFAAEQHDDAGKKHGNRPYVAHLDEVVEVLMRYGCTESKDYTMLAAAYLHDVCEDCGIDKAMIETGFGQEVADLVWAVTNESGKNRREKHLKTYPKILAQPGAVQLKLADRIANLERCVFEMVSRAQIESIFWPAPGTMSLKYKYPTDTLFEMYKKEHPEFRQTLYRPSDPQPIGLMWQHVDELVRADHLTNVVMHGIKEPSK